MTLRKIALFAVAMPVLTGFFACNTKIDNDTPTATSVAVKSFSLAADDSVLANLDSVFFSIDLVKGLIFNADSLPYGTDVSRLVPVITMLETASSLELTETSADGKETTHNYLYNSTDTIDFTNPVKLHVVSYNGEFEMDYTIKVNVHKMVSDSLNFAKNHKTTLPGNIADPKQQKTVRTSDKFFTLITDGNSYSLATCAPTNAPLNAPQMWLDEWTNQTLTFSFTPEVETFAATDDALYILSDAGDLYESTDEGASWSATGINWQYIYGTYDTEVLGLTEQNGYLYVQSYPSENLYAHPAEMPVCGTSVPVSYTFPMSRAPQIVIIGGEKADGTLSGATWGFDGNEWSEISARPLPSALSGVSVAMYATFEISGSWVATERPTLVAFGGIDAAGKPSPSVFISTDFGVNWVPAADEMQLPSFIPPFYNAQVYAVDSTYDGSLRLARRISKPTEQWDCPYLYIFGGLDKNGTLQNSIWRGVINRMSFRPIE